MPPKARQAGRAPPKEADLTDDNRFMTRVCDWSKLVHKYTEERHVTLRWPGSVAETFLGPIAAGEGPIAPIGGPP